MKNWLLAVVVLLLTSSNIFSQNASDYFPAQNGYKWHYKITPYDSLNRLVDSLSAYTIDSLIGDVTYEGKPAKFILSKSGTKETILDMPYLDSSFVNLETTNVSNYINSLLGIDTAGIGGFLSGVEGWYQSFKLASAVNSSYTLFTQTDTVSYSGADIIVILEVKAKRLADEVIITPIGSFTTKKFLLNPAVKAKLVLLPFITIPIVTINDTVWIAPGNYMVRNAMASAVVDLSIIQQPSFYIPGSRMEILRAPAIVTASPTQINVPFTNGTSSFNVANAGSGEMNWKAKVTEGIDWLTLTNTSGSGNGTVGFSYSANSSVLPRTAFVEVWDDSAFGAIPYIIITQDPLTSVNDENVITEYRLYENYPNPFNPATTIKYDVPSAGNVTLTVYNSLGKETAVLVNENKPAGSYQIKFDASKLTSGVYFYKITAGAFTSVRKMILMK